MSAVLEISTPKCVDPLSLAKREILEALLYPNLHLNYKAVLQKYSDQSNYRDLLNFALKEAIPAIGSNVEIDHEPDAEPIKKEDKDGWSALMFAADQGSVAAMALVIKYDPESLHRNSTNGLTPLMVAIGNGSIHTFRFILKHDPDALRKTLKRWSPLISAAAMGHVHIMDDLLELNPRLLNQKLICGKNALHSAAERGQLGAIKYLLSQCAKLNCLNKTQEHEGHFAKANGHDSIVEYLGQANAVFEWVKTGDLKKLNEWVENGNSLNFRTSDNESLLYLALQARQMDVVLFLLQVLTIQNYLFDQNARNVDNEMFKILFEELFVAEYCQATDQKAPEKKAPVRKIISILISHLFKCAGLKVLQNDLLVPINILEKYLEIPYDDVIKTVPQVRINTSLIRKYVELYSAKLKQNAELYYSRIDIRELVWKASEERNTVKHLIDALDRQENEKKKKAEMKKKLEMVTSSVEDAQMQAEYYLVKIESLKGEIEPVILSSNEKLRKYTLLEKQEARRARKLRESIGRLLEIRKAHILSIEKYYQILKSVSEFENLLNDLRDLIVKTIHDCNEVEFLKYYNQLDMIKQNCDQLNMFLNNQFGELKGKKDVVNDFEKYCKNAINAAVLSSSKKLAEEEELEQKEKEEAIILATKLQEIEDNKNRLAAERMVRKAKWQQEQLEIKKRAEKLKKDALEHRKKRLNDRTSQMVFAFNSNRNKHLSKGLHTSNLPKAHTLDLQGQISLLIDHEKELSLLEEIVNFSDFDAPRIQVQELQKGDSKSALDRPFLDMKQEREDLCIDSEKSMEDKLIERNCILGTWARLMEIAKDLKPGNFPISNEQAEHIRNASFHAYRVLPKCADKVSELEFLDEVRHLLLCLIAAIRGQNESKAMLKQLHEDVERALGTKHLSRLLTIKFDNPSREICFQEIAEGENELRRYKSASQVPDFMTQIAYGFTYGRLGAFASELRDRFKADFELASRKYQFYIQLGKNFRHGGDAHRNMSTDPMARKYRS